MTKNKLEQFTLSDVDNVSSPYIAKNFVLTNSDDRPIEITLDYPFSFDGIVFAICTRGTSKLRVNFKEYDVEKNSLITILPRQIVERMESSKDFFIELLAFSPDFISDLSIPKDYDMGRKVTNNPILKVSEEDIQNLLRYYTFIIETFNNKRHKYLEQSIKGLLYSLLLEIASLYSDQDNKVKEKASSRSEEIFEQFFTLLKDHYKEGRTASYYAEKMFITPKYLSSTLKKVTGRPINSIIEDVIIIGAKTLLKSTNLTVLQISEELNFPNPSYFGRFFKKNTGMTPRSYRES